MTRFAAAVVSIRIPPLRRLHVAMHWQVGSGVRPSMQE